MKIRLLRAWETLSASYWFVPSVMVLAAAALSELAIRADDWVAVEWLRMNGWVFANQPDGARELLSTVAGSMITVAGVTFSMTILAISHASAQVGPRLFSDFMRDRGNQVTLGTFIATFIFCLLVLRTVRAGDPASSVEEFVPHVAVLVALVLAVSSVAVLIYFIHHVPETLSMTNLIGGVSRTLLDRIDALYPTKVGAGGIDRSEAARATFDDEGEPLLADRGAAYVQYLDVHGLMATAVARDVVLEIERRPGDFVSPGVLLARVHGAALSEEDRSGLREAFVCGPERTPAQDVLFPALQIVEIAVRALSPGVNDPFTAIRCLDHLSAAITVFGGRELPDAGRLDERGALRIVARPIRFEEFCDAILDALRPHVSSDATCCLRLLERLGESHDSLADPHHRAVVRRHAHALAHQAKRSVGDDRTLERVGVLSGRFG